jgi:hypothetical protein
VPGQRDGNYDLTPPSISRWAMNPSLAAAPEAERSVEPQVIVPGSVLTNPAAQIGVTGRGSACEMPSRGMRSDDRSADGTKGCRRQPKISSRRRAFVVIDNRVAPQARTNTSR